jgi:hypothetical protein
MRYRVVLGRTSSPSESPWLQAAFFRSYDRINMVIYKDWHNTHVMRTVLIAVSFSSSRSAWRTSIGLG